MTPKEKAIDLIIKMNNQKISIEQFKNASDYARYDLKRKVLIVVDEIIESKPSFPIEGEGGYFYEDIELSTEWWKKVRKEIEKL